MVRPTISGTTTPSVEDQLRDLFGEELTSGEPGSSVATGSKRRKQKVPVQRKKGSNALSELRKLLNRTDNMIPRLRFSRLIKELLIKNSQEAERISVAALCAIQEAAEAYVTQMFEDSYACTLHRGRVTLTVKDMELVKFLRGDPFKKKF